MPTATPLPGTITVSVIACGAPFGTRITRQDTGEGYDSVSTQSFTVPSGQNIIFKASGYGDYIDTYGVGVAPASITIVMQRKAAAGPCSVPATPIPGITPTPMPTPLPQCTPVERWQLQALDLVTPAGTAANPLAVPAGPLTLRWQAKGLAYGDSTAETFMEVKDVDTNTVVSSVDWQRPFNWDTPLSDLFAKTGQSNIQNLQTSHSNAWHWRNGWVQFDTAPLEPGHTYRIFTRFTQAPSCNFYNLESYVTVPADIRISVRQATLAGQDTGGIAQRSVLANGRRVGATNESGRLTYRRQSSDGSGPIALQVDTPPSALTWKITGSCLERAGVSINLDTHTVSGIVGGDCDLVWTQIPRPTITARAFFRHSNTGDYQQADFGTLNLVAGNGTVVGSGPVLGGIATVINIPPARLRALVGTTTWSLSYTPSGSIAWTQTLPQAGSGGDQIADDLAITFTPGDNLNNRFYVEHDGTIPFSSLTLRGNVALIKQDNSTATGAYGTVTAAWSHFNKVSAPVAADGSFTIIINNLAFSPTLRLSFQKSLPSASYDHANPGVADGQPRGNAVAPNQIDNILMSNNGVASDYQFILRELPPPPPPPLASGELRLWMHSHLDPQQGVYKSTSTVVAWPLAEILDIAPAVELAPLPVAPAGFQYEQRVVAWSYDGSGRSEAAQEGCRPGDTPDRNSGDTSLLPGCVYRFYDAPSAGQMNKQARIFWGVFAPETLPQSVYRYVIPQLQSSDLRLSVLVETAVVDTTTGQRWTQRQALSGTFGVRMAAPRTAK